MNDSKREPKEGQGKKDKTALRADEAAFARLLVIAEFEASLKKLLESTGDEAERAALEATEKAVKQMKEKALGRVYSLPFPLVDVKEKPEKK
jgi:hypothetical protein